MTESLELDTVVFFSGLKMIERNGLIRLVDFKTIEDLIVTSVFSFAKVQLPAG